ncbi:MAG TPA: restriction endonuclease subunit S [Flavobacteriaceae bacterium]|nr:restriction endonuclease subunit S [Flavobacteriaceae bacterium]
MVEVENKIQRYEKYKDSGVEWLGDIPEHWEVLPLFALTKIKSITNNNGLELLSVYLDRGVIRFSDVTEKRTNVTSLDLSKYQLVEAGDFVLNNQQAWRGSVGVSNYTGIVSPAYIVLSLSNNLNPIFANYLFRDGSMVSQYLINSKGVGTIQRNLYWPSLRRSNISLPPLSEQTKIAQFLDDKTTKIDEAITIKEQQISLLKERKQILIHKAVTRGLDDSVTLKDSGVEWIGKIPAHWEVKKLKYVLKTQGRIGFKGYTTSDLVDKDKGALTLGASHLDWEGNIILKKPVYISWKKYYESPEIMVSKGDVIIVQRGSTCGKVALIDNDYGPTTINPSLVLLKEIIGHPQYMFLGIKVVLNGILNLVSKTAIPMLSQFQIDNIEIPFPNKKEQKEISAYIDIASQKIETAIGLKEQEIEMLKEYKSSLINSVVTGKVRVC